MTGQGKAADWKLVAEATATLTASEQEIRSLIRRRNAAIIRLARAGNPPTAIARGSGMTRDAVNKILHREAPGETWPWAQSQAGQRSR